MQSHLVNLVLFAGLVSTVFALLLRESVKERLRFAAVSFAAFVVSAIAVGWLMYPFPS